jgi:hypothetical protein
MDFDPFFPPLCPEKDSANFLNWYPVSWNGIQLHSLYGSALFDCGGNWHYRVKLGPKDRGDFLDNHKRDPYLWSSEFGCNMWWNFAKEKYHVTKCCSRWLRVHLSHKIGKKKRRTLVTMGVDVDKVESCGWLGNS